MPDPLDWDLCTAAAAIRRRDISALELARLSLVRIAAQADLNAFIHHEPEAALAAARRADEALARGTVLGALHGLPVARKDNIGRAGQVFTSGSRAHAARRATATAAVLERLDAAGAVDLGGTNLSEFAFHVHGFNSLCGPPRNPWDRARIAGGSSGGSAAAVAAGLVFGAAGSDSGGSIRSPAALCGVAGLAPTQGLVPRAGMAPGSASADVIGPLARSVRDCARLLAAMSGAGCEAALDAPLRGRRLGVLRDYRDVPPATVHVLEGAAAVFAALGAERVEIALPALDRLNARAAIVFVCESAASQAETLRTAWHDIHPEVRDRLLLGFAVPVEIYRDALAARAGDLRRFCAEIFTQCDLVLLPSAPEAAPPLADCLGTGGAAGQAIASSIDPGRYTRAVNYLGLPALAVPAGFDDAGLPLGLQLLGRPFGEALLLNAGHRYQQATGWHLRRPPAMQAGKGVPA